MVYPLSEEEYRKNNKNTGINDILVEQLQNIGPNSHKWLLEIFNTCFTTNKIPEHRDHLRSYIYIYIAIQKPDKESTISEDYRPISPSYVHDLLT